MKRKFICKKFELTPLHFIEHEHCDTVLKTIRNDKQTAVQLIVYHRELNRTLSRKLVNMNVYGTWLPKNVSRCSYFFHILSYISNKKSNNQENMVYVYKMCTFSTMNVYGTWLPKNVSRSQDVHIFSNFKLQK